MEAQEDIYILAKSRWAGVDWDRPYFDAYVSDKPSKYIADLYLAGAAGYRLHKAWEIIDRNYEKPICIHLKRKATGEYTPEEIWRIVVVRQMEELEDGPILRNGKNDGKRGARILLYGGRASLETYLKQVAYHEGQDQHRNLKRTKRVSRTIGRRGDDDFAGIDPPAKELSPDQQVENRQLANMLVRALQRVLQSLPVEEQALISLVYFQGVRQREAAKIVGWDETKAAKRMKGVRVKMHLFMRAIMGKEWSVNLEIAWIEAMQDCWKKNMQESEAASSNQ